jgi:hypothetical protein
MSLTWPDPNAINRLNKIIFETQQNPFGLASYNPSQPVNDFVGRQEQLTTFNEQIKIVIQYKKSRAVRLEGPAGVGKSTLFNYLKESIENERAGKKVSSIQYLLSNIDIFSTYFSLPDQILEFANIWKPMLEGLVAGFDKETGFDISLPEYVAYHFIYRMFVRDPTTLASIIWLKSPMPPNLGVIRLKEIIDPIQNNAHVIVPKLQAYFNDNKRELRNEFKAAFNGQTYELKRSDNSLITDLFRVLDEDDNEDYLEKIIKASPDLFRSSEDLINYFNDLTRIYACAARKQPLFLIGIDEFAKSDRTGQEDYFIQLGNLMVKLRNSLDNTLFVLISTSENWRDYDAVIKKKSDLDGQISGFMYGMALKSLETQELIQVFRNRMNRFWDDYASDRNAIAPYYPFSDAVFEYVYLYNRRQLRETINFLNGMWMQFHYNRSIPRLETMFEALREVRRQDKKPLDPKEMRRFEWEIINKAFNDPSRFNSNAKRSSAIEKGLENAWKCLMKGQFNEITNVQNNPTISTPTGKRRPDILITLLGALGAEYRRNFEFQVKAYAQNSEVELKHIESSLELFNEQHTDFIYFIITGKGLTPDAEAKVKQIEHECPARIRRPFLTEDQIDYLYLLALFEEVMGRSMERTLEDESFAKYVIEKIIGQRVEDFLKEVRSLAKREPLVSIQEEPIIAPEPIIYEAAAEMSLASISPVKKGQMVLDKDCIESNPPKSINESETTPPSQKSTDIPSAHWVDSYPGLAPFKFELCALGDYLKTREKTANRGKFTISTVEKNVISPNANLDKKKFKALVTKLQAEGHLTQQKTSFVLSKSGEALYNSLKADHFKA